jgi:hypothetical protein
MLFPQFVSESAVAELLKQPIVSPGQEEHVIKPFCFPLSTARHETIYGDVPDRI